MRNFYLKNAKDLIYDLTTGNLNFFHDPQGLGYSKTITYSQHTLLRNATDNKINFGQITGSILFKTYMDYKDFISYVASSESLYLYYTPSIDVGTYYTKIEVSTIDKSEIDKEFSMLKCSVTFDALTYWQKEQIVITINPLGPENLNPNYPYSYNNSLYATSIGTSQTLQVGINNLGDTYAPIKISLIGEGLNPTWSLGDQYGGLLMEIQHGQQVTIDSREDKLSVLSGLTKLDMYKDYTKVNFIYAPKGQSILLLRDITSAEVTVYEQYSSI